jgi:hypothetical protein
VTQDPKRISPKDLRRLRKPLMLKKLLQTFKEKKPTTGKKGEES